MPVWAEMLGDKAIGGEEPLRLTRRLKALHASLALAGGLMRVLGAVVEIAMLAMFHPRENLALSGPVALQFVGDNHALRIAS
jgi:hypothetical protein